MWKMEKDLRPPFLILYTWTVPRKGTISMESDGSETEKSHPLCLP